MISLCDYCHYERIGCCSVTSDRLTILVYNEFGEIPFDSTIRIILYQLNVNETNNKVV
jgi:hypothetical protein